MSYLIEGGGSSTFSNAKSWLYAHPEESHLLLKAITEVGVVTGYYNSYYINHYWCMLHAVYSNKSIGYTLPELYRSLLYSMCVIYTILYCIGVH